MDNKQIIDNIEKLSNQKIVEINKPFNTKSVFFIVLSLSLAAIIAVTICFLLLYFI